MARTGRKRRGERAQTTVRVPVHHMAMYEDAAREKGLTLSDYFAVVMAAGHGLDIPDYIQRDLQNRDQEELPLAQIA